MKVLTAAQMREVDRRTVDLGIPGLVLMENAGHRVVEFLETRYAPLAAQRIVVLCGKGNNGGDGFVVARQLYTRFRPRALHVVFAGRAEDLKGDAAANFRALAACGCPLAAGIAPEMRNATLLVDALLGTGLTPPVRGEMADLVREVNSGFPDARVVAVDIPSGLPSDAAACEGEAVRADATVTFTAPKVGLVLPPNCDFVGELRVGAIGSPPALYEQDESIYLALIERAQLRALFQRRSPGVHKGSFGHVLVVGGSRGKTGAAALAGMAALRVGSGLVTVASAESAIPVIASHAAELMTEPLPETDAGSISLRSFDYGRLAGAAESKHVHAIGPGLGTHPETVAVVRRLVEERHKPLVVDADGLNALAGSGFRGSGILVLTPHPGEMSRLCGVDVAQILKDRVAVARSFAMERGVWLVLKGQRTLVAFPNGRVWINPTGTAALATGGTGDILTGLIAGLLAQFPEQPETAVLAAVYLHGRSGELGAQVLGEKSLLATDLLTYLPKAMEECAAIPD